MNANQRPLILHFQSIFFTLLITTLLVAPNSRFSNANSISTLKEENKVTLELYYETLCPYCSRFIVNFLYKIFETDIITITHLNLVPYGNAKISVNGTVVCQLAQVFDNGIIGISDLNLVPWGNAKLQSNTTFKCQHGEYECLLNTVEACAIEAWPDVNEHFPFIYCVENLVYEGKYLEWETCYKTLGLDDKPVTDCVISEKGLKLNLKYAAETSALQPPHTYVPWVVVDGQPLYDDYENFLSYICKAYQGSAAPAACEDSVTIIKKPKWKLHHPVCYKEAMTTLSGIRATLLSWIDQLMF